MTTKKILIIEKDEKSDDALTKIFPYNFISNKNAYVDISQVKKDDYSMIILDEEHQHLQTVIEKMRQWNEHTPIYLLTANSSVENMVKTKGVTGVIKAPYLIEDYKEVFDKHFSENHNETGA